MAVSVDSGVPLKGFRAVWKGLGVDMELILARSMWLFL